MMRRHLIAPVIVVAVSACGLTNVSAPDLVSPGSLDTPAGAQTRDAGAVSSFATGFSTAAVYSGIITDELTDLEGLIGQSEDERRLPDPGGSNRYPYDLLSAARVNALIAIGALQRYDPQPPSQIGELFALVGVIEVQLSENMCAGVRLASVVNGTPVEGAPLTGPAILQRALADFDSAAAYGTDSSRILSLANIGKARALVDLGQMTNAAAAVAAVATSYSYQAGFSVSANQINALGFEFVNQYAAVSDREGGNGLDFVSALDPRVQTTYLGVSPDGVTPDYVLTSYNGNQAVPMPVATGIEARLIEAEAALSASDATTWLSDLNALRADAAETGVTGLGSLSDPGSDTARISLMFRERAFWLFGTARRQGDLRRLIRQYGRPQNRVFPTGPYKTGQQQYGSDVNFPVYGDLANTNLRECLNRDP